MAESPRNPVRDEEAYEEKLSLILESWTGTFMEPYQEAEKAARETTFSRVCTEAIYGDWTPAWNLCTYTCRRFGHERATELMADITTAVAKPQFWREALKMR
jgi:hypothetical protein